MRKATPVVLLHDAAIDEYMATILLTTMPEVDLRAIVVVNGDCVATPAMNAAWRIQQLIKRTSIPLGLSAARGYNPFPWQYRGDCIKVNDLAMLQAFPQLATPYADGDDLLCKALQQADAPVTILCTAPLTPIAMLLDRPDGAQLVGKIGQLIWMGGAVEVGGNLDPATLPAGTANPYAEWNVFWDPFSVDRVFKATKFPITLFPLDITNQAAITKEFMASLLVQAKTSRTSDLAYQSYELVAAEAFYDMWDVTATVWLARPELYQPPSSRKLAVVTADEGMQGALVPTADGRVVDVVLGFAKAATKSGVDATSAGGLTRFYGYVLQQLQLAR